MQKADQFQVPIPRALHLDLFVKAMGGEYQSDNQLSLPMVAVMI